MTERFTLAQQEELRQKALDLITQRKWDTLPWEDAWSGKYPDPPLEAEIEHEFLILCEKAARILDSGLSESECGNLQERLRLIALEYCETFNIYGFRENLIG
jgi:hypothetical protein